MTDASAFSQTLATVRQTNAAHASALDALERALDAETVKRRASAKWEKGGVDILGG
jgi:hypothetical protein